VTNQWDLLAPLGIGGCDPARDPLEMPQDPAIVGRLDRRLRESGIEPGHSVVLIHVSAGNPFRRWPAESFASVAASLVERSPDRRVVLVSGPSEPTAAIEIANAARARAGAAREAIVAAEYDLAELHALAARAAVYIGTDSGPLHVAATTGTPIVQLLGPKLAEQSRPWRDARSFSEIVDVGALPCRPCDERRCEPGDFRCLTGITPDRIVAAAERAMEKTPGVIFAQPELKKSHAVSSSRLERP
jgi:ADP-heptose:LPS heptosyltransferase